MASFFYFTNDRQEYNSGLFTVYSLSHMVNSFTSCGSNLLSAFSNSLQNKSELKLTFLKTVLVYSNIALAIVVGSFVIPMAQYFWYVRDDDSSDKFFAEDVPEPPQKKGWF